MTSQTYQIKKVRKTAAFEETEFADRLTSRKGRPGSNVLADSLEGKQIEGLSLFDAQEIIIDKFKIKPDSNGASAVSFSVETNSASFDLFVYPTFTVGKHGIRIISYFVYPRNINDPPPLQMEK